MLNRLAIPRLLLLLFILCLPVPAVLAQDAAPPLAGIAHVALRVKNLAVSRAFYQGLGFEEAFDLRKDDIPYESFIKIGDRQFIELYPVTGKDPTPAFLHLCFEGEDLQAIHDNYVSHGLTPKEVRKAGAGNLLFTMAGPAQPSGPQNIEYTQYLPGSRHSEDFGKHLGHDRIADRLFSVTLAMQDPDAAREFYLNQLDFKTLPGEPMTLHLPGNSGNEIEIVSASLGQRARFTLQTANLSKAGRHLKGDHIPFEKFVELIRFTDPDGNEILLRQR